MKKVIIVAMLLMLVLVGCGSDTIEKTGELTDITANEAMVKFENKESFILVIAQTTCSHCITYRANLEEFARSNPLFVYIIEADLPVNQDDGSFNNLYQTYFPSIQYTPTTYNVVDGEIVDEVSENMDSAQISEWLERNNIILE